MAPDNAAAGLVPIDITSAALDRTLYVTWPDGHVGVYSWDFLRGACPCVLCKRSHQAVDLARVKPVEGILLVDREEVGKYAVRFLWSDAHDSGIYSYEYLRSICRCSKCQLLL